MARLDFTLVGRDQLSRVLDRAGDASDRLGRRLLAMSINGDAAVRRFTSNASRNLAGLERDTTAGRKALTALRQASMLLAPAAIPAAASLAPIAAGAGAVTVALGAMGAALGPQITKLGEASDAQKKHADAVAKNGAASKEAAAAELDLQRAIADMPAPTRRAAAAVADLKENYEDWSDSLAGDTMEPLIKGVALTNTLLPRTTGLVKAAAGETDRFMTIIGGTMASPGFDRLNSKFTAFADSTMQRVNDRLVHLLRVSESGEVGGNARRFMDWARAQGPTVAATLSSVASALVNVLEAGSDVGVSLLGVIKVFAGIVAAVPPGAIALFLQLAIALKLTRAAALGMAAARTALAGFGASLVAMNTAAAAAPGRLAAVRAAIAALSRTAKVALAGTGIGLLVLGLTELSQLGRQAPPDVDKLTGSLKELGATGAVTGEAAKHFGADLDGLYGKVRSLTDPSTADRVQQFIVTLGGLGSWDSTPVKDAKENIDSIDKALAGLVSNGQADLAAAALKRLTAEYGKGGRDTSEFTDQLGDYESALADARFEAELAAAAQGLFGRQALSVQEKLAAQKASADGLRQSIQALSDTSRSAFDAQTKFEEAVDNVTKSIRENGATLDVGTEKGRANRDALSQMASATQDAAAKARENGATWETVAGIYDKGRKTLVDNIAAITGNRTEAKRLADQLLKMPSPKMRREMRTEDAVKGLDSVITAIRKTPNAKSVKVKALTSDAISLLRDLGFRVERMKDGRFKVIAETGTAKSNISAVQRARDALKSKTIDLKARDLASAQARAIQRAINNLRGKTVTVTTVHQTLGLEGTAGRQNRHAKGYASGGRPKPGEIAWVGENGPELMQFTGTERIFDHRTSMSMIKPSAKAGASAGQGLIVGMTGSTSGVRASARAMAAAVTAGIREELQIASPSKKTKALAKDVGKGFIDGLTGSRDKIKAVAKDLATDIKAAFSGKKESALLKLVDQQTKKLLDAAAKRDKIAAKIAEAKAYAADVTRTARDQSSLSALGMQPEEVTAGGIKAGLASKLAQIKQFTKYIDILAKRGLAKGLLRQILNMGPEAGYAYASALAGADRATLNSINKTQSAIDSESKKLGNKGADHLYDSGRRAGKGFLTGLAAQQKDIENLMVRIAKGMQKAIKKALGIKSPSRVMAEIGAFSTRGLARGLTEALPAVDQALGVVSQRVASTRPVLGRAAVTAGRGGMTVYVTVEVAPTADRVAIGREIRTTLLDLKRINGGAALGLA
jgi:chorismate mutase